MKTLKLKLFFALLVLIAVGLSGCSAIMRPPPAAAFMDSYDRDDAVRSISFSFYTGELDNGWHDSHHESEYHYSHAEWWGDLSFASYFSGGYFSFGWGVQTFTPFLQGGFVSPYFGLTGWSNTMALFLPMNKSDEGGAMSHYSGGGMAIEQIPLGSKWKLGFTEHVSRNGVEFYYVDDASCEGVSICNIPERRPRFYTEVGGGFYVSRSVGDNAKISLEARYGYDLDEKRNRVALTLDIWGFSGLIPIGGNDAMKVFANKNIEKMKKLRTTSVDSLQEVSKKEGSQKVDSLHTIKRQWFRFADSAQTVSYVYHPSDSVIAATSKGICYNEDANTVWLKQDYGNMVYQVSADSLDYCQLMERKNLFWTSVAEGALFFLPGGLITGSAMGGLAVSVGVGVGFWAVFNFAFNPEELAPKEYPELCSERHSREDIIKWLKQYPCGGEKQLIGAGK